MAALSKTKITASYAFTFTSTVADPSLPAVSAFKASFRGPATVDLDGVADSNTVTFSGTLPASGLYRYSIIALDANSNRYLLEVGDVTVAQDPTAISIDTDLRSYAQKTLDAIEAVLAKKATSDQQAYTIAGRSITKIPFKELYEMRELFRKEVAMQKRKLAKAVLIRYGS